MIKFMVGIIFIFFNNCYLVVLVGGFFICFLVGLNSFENLGILDDILASLLIFLSLWVVMVSLLSVSFYFIEKSKGFFKILYLNLLLFIFLFSINNIFIFFMLFELSVFPMLIMILKFGYQPERWRAGIYLVFFTFFSSVPLFLMMILFISKGVSWFFLNDVLYLGKVININLFFFLPFFTKLPMYGLHLWLPKAHVEAPLVGSLLLAGILLKLGGLGMIRVLFFNIFNSFYVISWGLLGALISSMISFRQSDLKCFIAYSSVGHMSMALLGLVMYMDFGVDSGAILMINHGLVSSSMFCLASLLYERLFSRNILLLSGVGKDLGGGVLVFFFFGFFFNLGLPPFLGFFSEILIYMGLSVMGSGMVWVFIVFLFMVMGSMNIFFFMLLTHSSEGFNFMNMMGFNMREIMMMLLFLFPVLMFVLSFFCFV